MAEDLHRGDVALAFLLKRQNALRFAVAAVGIAFAIMLDEARRRYRQPRATGILVALALWGAVLLP